MEMKRAPLEPVMVNQLAPSPFQVGTKTRIPISAHAGSPKFLVPQPPVFREKADDIDAPTLLRWNTSFKRPQGPQGRRPPTRKFLQARFRCKRVRFHAAEQTAIEVENEPSVDPESPQDKENRRSRLQLLADRFRNICDSSNAGGSNSPRQNTKRSPSTGASISKATSPSSDASPARCASPVVSLNSPAVPQQRSPLKRSQSSPMGLCSTVILKDMKTTELGEDVQALVQRARNQAFEEASILTADYEDLVKRHKVLTKRLESEMVKNAELSESVEEHGRIATELLDRIEKESREKDKLHQTIQQLQGANKELQDYCDGVVKAFNDMKGRYSEYKKTNLALEENLRKLKGHHARALSELEEIKTSSQREIEGLQKDLKNTKSSLFERDSQVDNLKIAVSELQVAKAQAEAQSARHQSESRAAHSRIEQVESELIGAQREISDLQTRLSAETQQESSPQRTAADSEELLRLKDELQQERQYLKQMMEERRKDQEEKERLVKELKEARESQGGGGGGGSNIELMKMKMQLKRVEGDNENLRMQLKSKEQEVQEVSNFCDELMAQLNKGAN